MAVVVCKGEGQSLCKVCLGTQDPCPYQSHRPVLFGAPQSPLEATLSRSTLHSLSRSPHQRQQMAALLRWHCCHLPVFHSNSRTWCFCHICGQFMANHNPREAKHQDGNVTCTTSKAHSKISDKTLSWDPHTAATVSKTKWHPDYCGAICGSSLWVQNQKKQHNGIWVTSKIQDKAEASGTPPMTVIQQPAIKKEESVQRKESGLQQGLGNFL